MFLDSRSAQRVTFCGGILFLSGVAVLQGRGVRDAADAACEVCSRRIERDLNDGAQRRLVALRIELDLV